MLKLQAAGETPLGQAHAYTWRWAPGFHLEDKIRDFPEGPVVKTLPSNAGGAGSIPGREAKIPHASQPKKPKHKKKPSSHQAS